MAFHSLTLHCKSIVLAFALWHDRIDADVHSPLRHPYDLIENSYSLQTAALMVQLEEEVQAKLHGKIEGAHDLKEAVAAYAHNLTMNQSQMSLYYDIRRLFNIHNSRHSIHILFVIRSDISAAACVLRSLPLPVPSKTLFDAMGDVHQLLATKRAKQVLPWLIHCATNVDVHLICPLVGEGAMGA